MNATPRSWTKEIRERCERATPGPWDVEEWERPVRKEPGQTLVDWRVVSLAYSDEEPGICGGHSKHWPLTEPDAGFIAHARQDIPRLLNVHDALVAAVRRVAELTTPCIEAGSCPHTMCIRIREARAALKLAEGDPA